MNFSNKAPNWLYVQKYLGGAAGQNGGGKKSFELPEGGPKFLPY